jgi:hypothetical protein
MSTPVTFVLMARHGTFLGTRFLGAAVRKEILDACSSSQSVIVDFAGVEKLSHSFADECIGALLDELGIPVFRGKVRFKGASDEIALLLRLVTSRHAKKVQIAQ